MAENGELGSGGGGVDIPTVLRAVVVSRHNIPTEINTPSSFSIQKGTNLLSDNYFCLVSPNNEDIILDNIRYTGGNTINLIPEAKVTGSGSYTYKVDYTVISNGQINFTITTTEYSYNTGYIDVLVVKKEL
jgi:hypothetical protein